MLKKKTKKEEMMGKRGKNGRKIKESSRGETDKFLIQRQNPEYMITEPEKMTLTQ